MKTKLATLALIISLGGCATTGGVTTANITSAISTVQSATVTACGFLPTAATVSSILASLVPGGSAIEQMVASIASQICAAVAPKPISASVARRAAIAPTVNGVVVHGRFVR